MHRINGSCLLAMGNIFRGGWWGPVGGGAEPLKVLSECVSSCC